MKIFFACIAVLFIVTSLSAQQPNGTNNKSSVTINNTAIHAKNIFIKFFL